MLKEEMMVRLTDNQIIKELSIDAKTLAMFKKVRDNSMKEVRALAKKKGGKIKVLGISGSARDLNDLALEKSNSETLLEKCLASCKELGAEVELIPLRKYSIKYCKACYSTVNTHCHFYCSCYPKGTPQGDDMTNLLYDKVLSADVIIFATPVNNFKISTLMAAFIDRCISLDGSLSPANPKVPKDKELNKKHMKFIELTGDSKVSGSGFIRRFAGKVAGIIVTGHEEGASMVITNLFMTLNHFGMIFPPFSNMYAMASVCNSTGDDKSIINSGCYDEEVQFLAENMMTAAQNTKKCKNDWAYDVVSN